MAPVEVEATKPDPEKPFPKLGVGVIEFSPDSRYIATRNGNVAAQPPLAHTLRRSRRRAAVPCRGRGARGLSMSLSLSLTLAKKLKGSVGGS